MKKILTLMSALFVAGSMIAGNLDLTFDTLTMQASVSGYTTTWKAVANGHNWTIANFNNNKKGWPYIKCGRKDVASTGTIRLNEAVKATAVEVTVDALTSAKVNAAYLLLADDTTFTTADTVRVTLAKGNNSFAVPAALQNTDKCYKLVFDCAAGSGNGLIQISKVSYLGAIAGPDAPVFSLAAGTYNGAQTLTLTTATEGAEIHYSTTADAPTLSSPLYTEPLAITQTTTIKAAAFKDGEVSNVVAQSYVIVYTQGQGTETDPYTVTDVKALNNNGEKAWVQGIIVGAYNKNKVVTDIDTITHDSIGANIALAIGTDTIPVQLPAGDIRTALALTLNPTLMGAEVKVKGELLTYFSTTGVKNVTAYEIIGGGITALEEVAGEQKAVKFFENGKMYIRRGEHTYSAEGHLVK